MNVDRFQRPALLDYEKKAAWTVYELADTLQDLLCYAEVDDLSQATRTELTKQYRVLRATCVHYDMAQTLEFNPSVPGRFRKVGH